MTKPSAGVIAALARGELWALHIVRSTEVMGSPVNSPAAAQPVAENTTTGKATRIDK
ncbi:hypothetical protein LTR53_015694 [Teratosphaeriaceae sp. CCFEE 6253]|nr:hypothetical protein LTR53_015694 [Teratosphaeriaceae sp. CCFEE 6253]